MRYVPRSGSDASGDWVCTFRQMATEDTPNNGLAPVVKDNSKKRLRGVRVAARKDQLRASVTVPAG